MILKKSRSYMQNTEIEKRNDKSFLRLFIFMKRDVKKAML
jgi:hypothetical protein